ncbi:MAG TPA: hypothetical protein VKF81_13680 [Blastocatellia bacterium]|nr:hypothetical protein [Blastocatellia bacterium]
MYCPNCATPVDGVKFCRVCGTNVSLVTEAISGPSPEKAPDSDKNDQALKLARLDKGIQKVSEGVGMLVLALLAIYFLPGWGIWLVWWLIPSAFYLLGPGIAEIVRAKRRSQAPLNEQGLAMPPSTPPRELPTPSNPAPPASVTEVTTRLLDGVTGNSEEKR